VFSQGQRPSRWAALLASALVSTACAIALPAPASAVAACPPGKYCTDATGKYTLTVPPLPTTGILAAYRDCVWQVHVNFGDGSGADYVFEGEVGLSGSHTFPNYGEFHVTAALSNGYHRNAPTQMCPDYTQYATVLYRSPAEIAEAEAKEKQEQEEKEKSPGEKPNEAPGAGGQPIGSGGGRSTGQEEGTSGGSGPSHPILVWRSCSHNVYAHRVACRKARKVISGAQDKLSDRKSARVAGFQCHLTDDLRPISCRRGKGRVLGPLG
jgi:hypothetical protein